MLSPFAQGSYQNEAYGLFGKSSTDSEQHHKDEDVDYYQGGYSYFLNPVEIYTDLPAESTFFSRSPKIVLEADRSVRVPKDDFLKTRVIYDWSDPAVNHRLRIGAAYGQHKSESDNRHMNGGLAGVSVYFLGTGKADFDTSYVSGDGFNVSETTIQFRQVYTAYDNDIVFELGLRYDAYRNPHIRVGRRASGFYENSWNGRLGWYFSPSFQFGLGHEAYTRDYRYSKDSSSKNVLLVYSEWTPSVNISLFIEGAVDREVIDLATSDQNVTDDTARLDVGAKFRF
jgi:hypothetical protein